MYSDVQNYVAHAMSSVSYSQQILFGSAHW